MGVFGDGDNAKKSKRGKTDVARSLSGLGSGGDNGGVADWRLADATWLLGLVIETTSRGGAVSVGLSRDAGAWNVTIFLDGDRRTVWVSSSDDLNAKLEEMTHYMASLPAK